MRPSTERPGLAMPGVAPQRTKSPSIAGLVVLLLVMMVSVASTAVAQPEESSMVSVRILIYSGLPDPVLDLDPSDEALDELRQLIASGSEVVGFEGDTVTPAILGYKGLLISNPSGHGDLPSRVAIYRGVLESRDGEDTRFLADTDRALETSLLRRALAEGVIDGKLLESEEISREEPEPEAPEEPEGPKE